MKKEEFQEVMMAMEPYNNWLRDTEKGEGWHVARNQMWSKTKQKIKMLVDVNPDKKSWEENKDA